MATQKKFELTSRDVHMLMIRGVLAILFGFAAVFWPGITLVTLVYLFSAYILVNGIISLVGGLVNYTGEDNKHLGRILTVLLGLLEIGVGVYLLRHPTVSFATLVLLIGFTLLFSGIFEVVVGLFEKAAGMEKMVTVLMGIISVLAGLVVLRSPVSAGVAFVWVVGLYALITGPLSLVLAFSAKSEK